MKKNICLVTLCVLSLLCKSQTIKDTCLLLPVSIRVYIAGTDTNLVRLSAIKNGFTLTSTDPSFKITGFRFGFHDGSSGGLYLERPFEGNQFSISDKNDSFVLHLDGATRLFIDAIKAEKNNRCYYYRPIAYKVIP